MTTLQSIDKSTDTMDTLKRGLPVTIITGFLGSGKTTLLNHILQNQQGIKTAVLVNEFGEIGIDNDLIVTSDDSMVELSNGCICCTINSDLVDAVYRVLERDDKIDYLVVETTGVADPLPVALTFLGTELRDMTRLDSIITLVDSENFSIDLFNSEAAYNQLAYGDIILLNKTDLVDSSDVDLLEVKIRDIKPDARIIRTTKSQVSLPLILSVGLFESDKYYNPEDSVSHDHDRTHEHHHHDHDHDRTHEHHHHDHDHEHHHHHSNHLENDGFISVSFVSDKPFNIRKLQDFLDNKLSSNVFRAKGILWFKESPDRHIFHLSGKRFTIEDDIWKPNQIKQNKLVFIGQNLECDRIIQELQKCLVSE